MNEFIIVDGLPYLYANGKVYSVRWDESGFTVGTEVDIASVPDITYSELSVKAKCAGKLDSMTVWETKPDQERPEGTEPGQNVQPEDLDSMTVRELKEYAEAHNINLDGLAKKADILEAIKAVDAE